MGTKRVVLHEKRGDLLATISSRCQKHGDDVVIPFRNDDVPNFLARLDEFEKLSRNTRFVVK